jgi:hypothetical protein
MAMPDSYITVARASASVVCGLFGGVLNRILVKRSLGLTGNTERAESWEYGLVGDVIIGAGAGLATFFYGMYDLPLGRILLLALLGGVSGGNFFSNALQLREFKKERTRTRAYKEATETALTLPARRRQKDGQ